MKAKFELGAEFDMINKSELDDSLNKLGDLWRQYAYGLKYTRKKFIGQPANGILLPGPQQNYAWMVTMAAVTISAADAVQAFISSEGQTSGLPVGSIGAGAVPLAAVFGFSSRQVILHPGEKIFVQAFTGGTNITAGYISAVEAPAEQIFKLVGG